jgi:hypothetical protein
MNILYCDPSQDDADEEGDDIIASTVNEPREQQEVHGTGSGPYISLFSGPVISLFCLKKSEKKKGKTELAPRSIRSWNRQSLL